MKINTKFLFALLLMLGSFSSYAQIPPPGYYLKDVIQNFKDSMNSESGIKNIQSYYLSFMGEYRQAIKLMDEIYDNKNKEKLSTADSAAFVDTYKAIDATEYILERTKNKKLVMINESHERPQQRAYMITLLQKLYDQGFRYLGMEALKYDSLLNQRAYPVLNYNAWLLTEPVMGNIAREAMKIGFNVFSYEMDYKESVVPYKPEHSGRVDSGQSLEREIRQAFNVMKIFNADTGAKVILFAGLGHIVRGWNDNSMGSFVWRFLGRENSPLSIDQTTMIEKSNPMIENRYYLLANVDKPTVFVDEKNKSFTTAYKPNAVDIMVFHPRTKYIADRPDWLYQLDRIPYYMDGKKYKIQYPVLVKAYCKGEDINRAVPFDVIQLNDKKEKKPLLLKNGCYIIELKNDTQKELFEIEVN